MNVTLPPPRSAARLAGALYATIILLGLSGEILLRGPVIAAGPEGAPDAFAIRLSVLADTAMVMADVALALLLFLLLAPFGWVLAATASLFRLVQSAVLGANLLTLQAAADWADGGPSGTAEAHDALLRHAAGYDLGLFFFGVSTLVTAALVRRASALPAWLAPLLAAAGFVYLAGSTLRVLAPDLQAAFQPAYLIAIVAETAFAISLLRWDARRRRSATLKAAIPLAR